MRWEDFQFLAELLKRKSGLSLTQSRAGLILSRLHPVAERHGFGSVAELVEDLRYGNEALAHAVMEAMTIRDTSFFRDSALFDCFGAVLLPQMLRARLAKRKLSVWSAACATGQEPYSIAMIFAGLRQFDGWEIDILATDVSSEAIARAKEGLYTHGEVQRGLPPKMLSEHFRAEGEKLRIRNCVRRRVQFGVLNLLDSFAALGPFDVIFCRNVLMYFDPATKADILARLAGVLADDGYLVLGQAETMLGLSRDFAADGPMACVTTKSGNAQMSRAAVG
ncbi:MAG TPA: protein-glutamate O-methyltransferase CheR [Micropepsaceae bacterium]|jgi:chemotaxis protein methyltransferase CheR|nr:protein-glutamate O-methyltransferase CheR [Micropepsaceae bacterium]